MERFIRDQNLRLMRTRLATEKDSKERQIILGLIGDLERGQAIPRKSGRPLSDQA